MRCHGEMLYCARKWSYFNCGAKGEFDWILYRGEYSKREFSELSDICLVNSIESNKQLEHDTSNINLLFDSYQTLQTDDGKPKFEELGIIKKTEQ